MEPIAPPTWRLVTPAEYNDERWSVSTSTCARSSGRSTTSASPGSARRRPPWRPSLAVPRTERSRSSAHLVENDANPREDRRLAAALWIDGAAIDVLLDAEVEVRARELVALGFRPLDALHVAFAERAQARWFVTCDDDLVKVAVVAPRAVAWRSES